MNIIEASHINLNASEKANTCCQGVTTVDYVERNVMIVGILNLLGVRRVYLVEIKIHTIFSTSPSHAGRTESWIWSSIFCIYLSVSFTQLAFIGPMMVELLQMTEASSCWVWTFNERLVFRIWASDDGKVRPAAKDCMRARQVTTKKENGCILTHVNILRVYSRAPVLKGRQERGTFEGRGSWTIYTLSSKARKVSPLFSEEFFDRKVSGTDYRLMAC